jgi:hypothetical protein
LREWRADIRSDGCPHHRSRSGCRRTPSSSRWQPRARSQQQASSRSSTEGGASDLPPADLNAQLTSSPYSTPKKLYPVHAAAQPSTVLFAPRAGSLSPSARAPTVSVQHPMLLYAPTVGTTAGGLAIFGMPAEYTLSSHGPPHVFDASPPHAIEHVLSACLAVALSKTEPQ